METSISFQSMVENARIAMSSINAFIQHSVRMGEYPVELAAKMNSDSENVTRQIEKYIKEIYA